MKNIDKKKLALFIGIIIILVALIVLIIIKSITKEKPVSDEESNTISKITLNYINKLTLGYDTDFDGIDFLYTKDETKYKDLSTSTILTVAARYTNNELNNSIPNTTLDSISQSKNIDPNKYTFYTGENIRTAIKNLFNVDFANTSSLGAENYLYGYTYLSEYDMYLQSKTIKENQTYDNQLDFKIIKTVKTTKNTYKTTMAIAYVNIDNNKLKYAKDSNFENIIFETTLDNAGIPEDKVNEFEKFTITYKKVNNQYTFDNIKKA